MKMTTMTLPGILLFGISGGEILMLILLVLLLFGPKKIPEIARMIGKGLGEVRKVQREINSEIHRYSSEMEGEVRRMESEVKKEVEAFKHTPGPEDRQEKDQAAKTSNSDSGKNQTKTGDASDNADDADLPFPYRENKDHRKTQEE